MKRKLFFVLMSIYWCFGCGQNVSNDGFLVLKPGHFCQLGAIDVAGDTVFVAGSYIAEENPNLSVQPVYSYAAAIDGNGNLLWEHQDEQADYIRWKHVKTNLNGLLYAIGSQESPIEGNTIIIAELQSNNGEELVRYLDNKPSVPLILDAWVHKAGLALLYSQAEWPNCSNLQLIAQGLSFSAPSNTLCHEGNIQTGVITPTLDCFISTGDETTTEHLFLHPGTDTTTLKLTLPLGMDTTLVNSLAPISVYNIMVATTAKNAQGPCLWKLGTTDSTYKQTCLSYWPFHGNTKLLRYKSCSVMAFNAADERNEHRAHVVMVSDDFEVAWQQSIDSKNPFTIQDIIANGNKLYVAGTLEMGENGSALAVKVLDLPSCH